MGVVDWLIGTIVVVTGGTSVVDWLTVVVTGGMGVSDWLTGIIVVVTGWSVVVTSVVDG